MDFGAVRERLPGLTRAVFGEDIAVLPRLSGELGERADPDRIQQDAVRARYDVDPGTEQIGDRREARNRIFATLGRTSFSIEHGALAWMPRDGDIVLRGNGGRFRVDEVNCDQPGLVILYVSKVKS